MPFTVQNFKDVVALLLLEGRIHGETPLGIFTSRRFQREMVAFGIAEASVCPHGPVLRLSSYVRITPAPSGSPSRCSESF
jgi:hypothetical protein